MPDSAADSSNPYRSPGAAADARGKLGWLVMLLILWPIVMAATGSILGFFVGRMAPANADPELWNPAMGAMIGAAVFAAAGVVVGVRKAGHLRQQLDAIHARREEMRIEVDRRLTELDQGEEKRSGGESA
jgi:hypothetical protein